MRADSVWQSFRFAYAGFIYVFRTQRNMRIHSVLATLIIAVSLFLGLKAGEWALLMLTIGLVFTFEILNTVVETLVDLVSPDLHPLAKLAKDAAAAAVLVASVTAIVVGLLILGPPCLLLLSRDGGV